MAVPASNPEVTAPVQASAPDSASAPQAASAPAAASSARQPTGATAPPAPDQVASAPVTASVPAASAPIPASTPIIKIAVYGDDQAAGIAIGQMGMPTVVSPNEAQALQDLLQKEFSDSGITVVNASTGGAASSLANELDGMDGGGAAEPQRMAQSGAQIAVEAHALNDALGGETLGDYSGYLGQWIQDAATAGVIPVLETDSPVCDGDHSKLGAYAIAMVAVAKQSGVPVIDQYTAISAVNDWQADMLACLIPNAQLDAIKAAQDEAVIAPLVQKLIKE